MEWVELAKVLLPLLLKPGPGGRNQPPPNCAVMLMANSRFQAMRVVLPANDPERFNPAIPTGGWPALRLQQFKNAGELVARINAELERLGDERRVTAKYTFWAVGVGVQSARANWLRRKHVATEKRIEDQSATLWAMEQRIRKAEALAIETAARQTPHWAFTLAVISLVLNGILAGAIGFLLLKRTPART